jgi:site-specific recombinase XerD
MVREYLAWQRDVRRRRAVTVYVYAGKLQAFLDWIDPTPIPQVSLTTLEAWLLRPRPGRGRGNPGKPATLATERAILSSLYKYVLGRGWAETNPTALLCAPSVRNEHPKPVEDGTWRKCWASDLADEARVVLGLGYFCGLRRAEIAALHGRHVRTHEQRLVGFPRKGGGDDVLDYGELVTVIADGLPNLLEGGRESFLRPFHDAVRRSEGGLILQWGCTSRAARAKHQRPDSTNDPGLIYKRMAKWGCEFTPHQLRHSFVTNLLRAGVPIHLVSVLANHSSIATTMRYAKLGGQDLREWRLRRGRDQLTSTYARFG